METPIKTQTEIQTETPYSELHLMIQALCARSRAHVCVHDVEGVLYAQPLRLPHTCRMHAGAFCDLAKSTPAGFDTCIRCKTYANKKALREARPFSGYCPYGLYEFARPVVFDGVVVCIIYVGHLVIDESEALHRLALTSRRTGTDTSCLTLALRQAQYTSAPEEFARIAQALETTICLYLDKLNWRKSQNPLTDCRRKAHEVKETIDVNFRQDLSLKQLAALYFVNEKYLGRIFQSEIGLSMRAYLNQVRLTHAAHLLVTTDRPVLQIALDCGFQTISYFNRQFMAHYHTTPLCYRREAKQLPDRVE